MCSHPSVIVRLDSLQLWSYIRLFLKLYIYIYIILFFHTILVLHIHCFNCLLMPKSSQLLGCVLPSSIGLKNSYVLWSSVVNIALKVQNLSNVKSFVAMKYTQIFLVKS